MTKSGGTWEAGPGGGLIICSLSLFFCRPASLPVDLQVLVIPNHVREVIGERGEESHVLSYCIIIVIDNEAKNILFLY
jgi:hypothetical protein